MEFFRHIWEKYAAPSRQPGNRKTPEQQRAVELEYAEEMVRFIYINGQVNLSSLSQGLSTMEEPSSDLFRETIRKMKFDSTTSQARSSDRIIETGVDEILDTVGATPEERKTIRSQALQEARDYWINRLTQPDLTPNEIILGRRRVTQLTEKIDKLNPPSPNTP